MTGVSVKGSAITARVRWLRELYGEDGVRALKAALDPPYRQALEGRILPHEWVPFELYVAVSTEIDRLYGKGDLELCRELGRYSAKVNLPTLYRIFYSLGSPGFIVRRAAKVWDVHYTSGRLDVDIERFADGTDGCTLTIVDFATPHRSHCLSVLGWCERSVELSGGTLVSSAETACRVWGDDRCVLSVRWRVAPR